MRERERVALQNAVAVVAKSVSKKARYEGRSRRTIRE